MTEIVFFIGLFAGCAIVSAREFWTRRSQATKAAAENFRNFQAYAVLKYHRAAQGELRHLSIADLRREYNITALYNEIGS